MSKKAVADPNNLGTIAKAGDIIFSNVFQLRQLNEAVFPVRYKEKFYRDVLTYPDSLNKLVYLFDVVCAAYCCRIEPCRGVGETGSRCYIMTLGVLAPYRGRKLGSWMLDNILKTLASSGAPEFADVRYACLHVHTANEDGLSFYKKHGFEVKGTEDEYYKDIQPRSAHFLQCDLARLRAAEGAGAGAGRENAAAAAAAAGATGAGEVS